MRKSQLLILSFFVLTLTSCVENKEPNSISEKPIADEGPPSEPCTNISWSKFPVSTHGYTDERFDTVIVKTYLKNSRFDTLVATYRVLNNRKIYDTIRKEKSFSLPEQITSDFDLLIVIGKDSYQVTEVKTEWVPRMCQSFCGYDCTISTFRVNGESSGGNILIKNPEFEYPWELRARNRANAKQASEYSQE